MNRGTGVTIAVVTGVPAAIRKLSRRRAPLLLALIAALFLAALAPAAGSAQTATGGLLVTFAARVCPSYTAISANRARNDIQESLRDLGADTPYAPGEAIDPAVEQASQPLCVPLPGWTFTLGTGYQTRAVSGPWGSLSIVTGAYPTAITTKLSTPLLDYQGQPTGQSIAGATTVELTRAQAERAAQPNSLWAQGGTPADPILDVPYPGQFGFGALRCAIDNLNGDNVEWIGFPSGTRHVFCFAYYVKPPPTSGTIVIRKQIEAPAGTAETFPFEGNITFNADGRFSLGVASGQTSAQETFIRAQTTTGHEPWNVRELVPPNWRLSGLTCSSQTGGSTAATSLADASAAITLGAGDTVTCTYTDQFVAPDGGLLLRKVSYGATGRFDFAVAPAGGGSPTASSALTLEEGLAVDAQPGPLSLPPGSYEITESQPAAAGGRWSLSAVECGGRQLPVVQPVQVTVASGAGSVCTFTNTFQPRGAIVIEKTTVGALATTGFVITPASGTAQEIHQSARTLREGVPVRASGSASDDLELGRYLLQETDPEPAGNGHWELTAVRCQGQDVPFAAGQAAVTLSAAAPAAGCAFTNVLRPGPEPQAPSAQPADLSISKRALAHQIALGSRAGYEILVANHGPGTAENVTVDDQGSAPATIVEARPSQGTCGHALPLSCQLGSIAAGARARIAVVLIQHGEGSFVNRAVVGSSTPDPTYQNDHASATVLVVRPAGEALPERVPSFTG